MLYRSKEVVDAVRLSRPMSDGNGMSGNAGDWLVASGDEIRIIPQEDFEKKWEAVKAESQAAPLLGMVAMAKPRRQRKPEATLFTYRPRHRGTTDAMFLFAKQQGRGVVLTPQAFAGLGIPAHSVRAGLQTLRRKGKIRCIGRGKWKVA